MITFPADTSINAVLEKLGYTKAAAPDGWLGSGRKRILKGGSVVFTGNVFQVGDDIAFVLACRDMSGHLFVTWHDDDEDLTLLKPYRMPSLEQQIDILQAVRVAARKDVPHPADEPEGAKS